MLYRLQICVILIAVFLAGCKPFKAWSNPERPCISPANDTRESWLLGCYAYNPEHAGSRPDRCLWAAEVIFCKEGTDER